jgi:ubiquinone/menaquinone biosynthesis C-methylase UbiE
MSQQEPQTPSDADAMIAELRQQVLDGWEKGADFFDERWGDQGDEFHHGVFAPAAERMLGLEPGARVIELACGNGGFARRLGRQGMRVVATDLSPSLIDHAVRRTETISDQSVDIEYQVVDATIEREIVNCGGPFDAAVCIMGVMSMPMLRPMFGGAWRVLRPRGVFVVVTLHPAFATSGYKFQKSEQDDEPHGLTVQRYLSRYVTQGVTNSAQDEPQIYFHRPLNELLGDAFASGLVLDGMEELPAPKQAMEEARLMWHVLPEIPMAVALRFRRL